MMIKIKNKIIFASIFILVTSILIGSGFASWIFVEDLKINSINGDVTINTTEHLNIGKLYLIAEEEAREELNYDPYNYNLSQEEHSALAELVNKYNYRKIVFTEGSSSDISLSDGMNFY